jgi:hypothetical protein
LLNFDYRRITVSFQKLKIVVIFMNHFVEPLIKIQTGSLMKTHEEELQQIKGLLRDHPKGLKITRIARELAMNRNAAANSLRSS